MSQNSLALVKNVVLKLIIMLALYIDRIKNLKNDLTPLGLVAAFMVVLVGMSGSAVLVFQAATAAGLDSGGASSWLGSLCLGMGLVAFFLSLYYRTPVLIAWSTAGAALLITGVKGFTIPEIIGAFVFSALAMFICGFTGIFEKMMKHIPVPIASALLGGVLLQFSLNAFLSFKTQPLLVGLMFLSYLIGRKFWPRATMLGVLIVGFAVAAPLKLLHIGDISFVPTEWHFTVPAFSIQALLSIGIPLFIVTMASQNLTGYAVMRAHGYKTPLSPLLSWTGFVNIITAFFGGFAINLAAVTAAIGMGPDVHPQPEKRYISGVISGFLYIVIGLMAGAITSVFAAFPPEMIMAIAGFALLGTISSCLQKALEVDSQREAAFVTFVVTASGIAILGVGSAFWGLIAGALTQFLLQSRK